MAASPACSQACGFCHPSARKLPAPTTTPALGTDPELQPQGRVHRVGPGHPAPCGPALCGAACGRKAVDKEGIILVSRKPSCSSDRPSGPADSWGGVCVQGWPQDLGRMLQWRCGYCILDAPASKTILTYS